MNLSRDLTATRWRRWILVFFVVVTGSALGSRLLTAAFVPSSPGREGSTRTAAEIGNSLNHMDQLSVSTIVRRYWWLFVLVVLAVGLSLAARFSTTEPVYESGVRVKMAPLSYQQVQLFDASNRSASMVRDEVTLERNNLIAAARSAEVRNRTVAAVGLTESATNYDLTVRAVPDSDFMDIVVSSPFGDHVSQIAVTQASESIKYYSELSAKPFTSLKEFINTQVTELGPIVSPLVAQPEDPASPRTPEQRQAVETYQHLLEKRTEVTLSEANALASTHVQIVAVPTAPTTGTWVRNWQMLAGGAAVGSLGVAFVLALLISMLRRTRSSTVVPPVAATDEGPEAASPVLQHR